MSLLVTLIVTVPCWKGGAMHCMWLAAIQCARTKHVKANCLLDWASVAGQVLLSLCIFSMYVHCVLGR